MEETNKINPLPKPRKGWEKGFIEMSAHKEDQLLIDDLSEDENLEDWK